LRPKRAQYSLVVFTRDQPPTEDQYTRYSVEPRGTGEFAVLADGDKVWRGGLADHELTRAITLTVMKDFRRDFGAPRRALKE
jgi:hypothetical protein